MLVIEVYLCLCEVWKVFKYYLKERYASKVNMFEIYSLIT
jgi:hypothetical protein